MGFYHNNKNYRAGFFTTDYFLNLPTDLKLRYYLISFTLSYLYAFKPYSYEIRIIVALNIAMIR